MGLGLGLALLTEKLEYFLFGVLEKWLGTRRAGARHGAGSSSMPQHLDFRCRYPAPARPASSRRTGVTVTAADARLALTTAYVGMWGDLESARGVWVTDVHALVTRTTPATGKAVSAAEAERWCAKALPKQDKQTR
jgi:hypothetical protein